MAIDKSISQMQEGLMGEMMPDAEMLEIEIVDPEEVNISVDGMEINIGSPLL